MIQVQGLGASEIQIGRKRITLATEVVFAIAFHLCVRAGQRITRDEIVETFWGAGDAARGRHSLRQMLYRLRQRGLALDEDGEELYLDPSRVACDVTAALDESWPERADTAAIVAASESLPVFNREISPRFREWLDGVRDRLAAQFRRAAVRQIGLARREGRWADLERWALLLLRSDPLNEEATLARAESAAMAGSKAMALEILDQYVEDLGDRASQIALPATVLRRRIAERTPDWSARGPREVALIGRQELVAQMSQLLDAAASGSGCAAELAGAPGVGKSRLAQEVLLYAELNGFRVLRTRATVANSTQPLSSLLALVPELRELPGSLGCHPTSLAVLSRASSNHSSPSTSDPPLSASVPTHLIVEALDDLLSAIASEICLAIHIDDLHHVDVGSRSVLESLIERSHTYRLFWLVTTRPQSASARRPLSSAHRLWVPPLDSDSSLRLAIAIGELEGCTIDEISATRIVTTAAGNPLFVCELSYAHTHRSPSDTLPSSLLALLDDRLTTLDTERTRLLRIISLLGGLATVARIRRMHRETHWDISHAVETLEEEGILRLSSSRALELHDCWHQALAARTSPAARAMLCHECASVLEADASSDDPALAWRAAELYEEAGDMERASPLFASVGDQMFARGLVAEAADIYRRLLSTATGAQSHIALRACYARALHASAQMELVDQVCSDSLSSIRPNSAAEYTAAVQLACLRLDSRVRLKRDHRQDLALVAELASDNRVPPEARQLACFTGIAVVFNDRSSSLEDMFFDTSQNLSSLVGATTVGTLVALMYAAERGLADQIATAENLLTQLESETLSDGLRSRALRIRATAQRWAGHTDEAYQLGERAFAHARFRGLPSEAAIVAEIMTYTALDAADVERATFWMTRWDESLAPSTNPERDHARSHARCRILASEGRFAEAAAIYDDPTMHWEFLEKRRAADLAILALCHASLGRSEECRTALNDALMFATENRPSVQMDFVVDMALRTLTLLGDDQRLATAAANYASRRQLAFPFPVARAFATLSAVIAT